VVAGRSWAIQRDALDDIAQVHVAIRPWRGIFVITVETGAADAAQLPPCAQ